jgi:hypothetical protein
MSIAWYVTKHDLFCLSQHVKARVRWHRGFGSRGKASPMQAFLAPVNDLIRNIIDDASHFSSAFYQYMRNFIDSKKGGDNSQVSWSSDEPLILRRFD